MNLYSRGRNILRGLAQLWGPETWKIRLWDREYATGRWDHCEETWGAPVYRYVEKYCQNGSVLDLGCGSGNTGNELSSTKYRHYTGVDISAVALSKARERSERRGRAEQNSYLQADIMSYIPRHRYDVILFRESVYYIPIQKIQATLERYAAYLQPQGALVIDLSGKGTRRYSEIVAMLESRWIVLEKHIDGVEVILALRPSGRQTP